MFSEAELAEEKKGEICRDASRYSAEIQILPTLCKLTGIAVSGTIQPAQMEETGQDLIHLHHKHEASGERPHDVLRVTRRRSPGRGGDWGQTLLLRPEEQSSRPLQTQMSPSFA